MIGSYRHASHKIKHNRGLEHAKTKDLPVSNASRRAGLRVAIARNPGRRFRDVACPDHRRQARGKGCLPVSSVAGLRLGLAPLPVAGVSFDPSSPGWLLKKASLWPLTHRHPPGPFPRIGRQSLHRLMGVSP
jgi:hypothetical protein